MDDGRPVVVLGAGGHAGVVAEALPSGRLAGHVAPEASERILLGHWMGDDTVLDALAASGHVFAPGVGFVDRASARRREHLLEAWSRFELISVIHPAAAVSPSSSLGPGSFVAAGATFSTGAASGLGAIVNTGAVVDHDCRLGDNVHVGPGATVSGDVRIGDGVLVGVGSTVKQGIRIGDGAVVGAGAAVVHDVPDGGIVIGVAARLVEER